MPVKMNDIRDLLVQADENLKKAKVLSDKALAEDRDLTEAEEKEYDGHVASSKRLHAAYKRQIQLDQETRDVRREGDDGSARGLGKLPDADADDPDVITGPGGEPLVRKPKPRIPAVARDQKREDMRGFSNPQDFLLSVYRASNPAAAQIDDRLLPLAAGDGMRQSSGPEGGFLMPPTFSSRIWDGLNVAPNNLLSMTDNFPVEGESLAFPANAETSRANGSRWGGAEAFWKSEFQQMTGTRPRLRQVKLEPQELYVLIPVTDKLLRNSPVALGQYVERVAISEINFKVGAAIIAGTGAGQPRGILNSGCLISVAKETGQAADTLVRENLIKMWARLHANARANATWFINQDVESELDRMFQAVKNVAGSENVGGFADMIYNPERGTIKGRPVMPIEFCETLGDKGDIIVGDMMSYLTGTRGGIDSAMSIHLRFDFAESVFRFIFEVDGQCWLASALTPFKGTTTLSTFVTLDARA